MSGDRPIWFAGDVDDPVAAAIARALPVFRSRLIACPGDLPSPWPKVAAESPRVVVVHRAILGSTDAGRLATLRRRLGPTRPVILCVGPHVRYADIERWAGLVDLVLPEAVAAETIGRHVEAAGPGLAPSTGRVVAVVSTQNELRTTWGAIFRAGGYEVVEAVQLEDPPGRMAAVWDVPVLEPTWAARLAARASSGPVVASVGFLDRTTRDIARKAGASACLDLPADLADLWHAVDRVAGIRRDMAHATPPAPLRGETRRRSGQPKR